MNRQRIISSSASILIGKLNVFPINIPLRLRQENVRFSIFQLSHHNWLMFDNGISSRTIIFEKPALFFMSLGGRLMVSTSGEIECGTWKLLRESRSLVINFNDEWRLLRPIYSDNNLYILQRDETNRNLILINPKSSLCNDLRTIEGLTEYLSSIERELIEKDRIKEEKRRLRAQSPADKERQRFLEQRKREMEQIRLAQALVREKREEKQREYLQNKNNEDYLINEIINLAERPKTAEYTGPILFGVYAVSILIPAGFDLYKDPVLIFGIGLLVTVLLILLIEGVLTYSFSRRLKIIKHKLKEEPVTELKQLNWYRSIKPVEQWKIEAQYSLIQDLIKLREERENA